MNKADNARLLAIGTGYDHNDESAGTFAAEKDYSRLFINDQPLVLVDTSRTDDNGNHYVRLSDLGKAEFDKLNGTTSGTDSGDSGSGNPTEGTNNVTEENTSGTEGATQAPASGGFVIENIAVEAGKRGRGPAAKYPFDQLQVGQSFFVASTKDKPKPATSLSSSVTSANKRYAKQAEKDGTTARKFAVQAVEGGARVGRVA